MKQTKTLSFMLAVSIIAGFTACNNAPEPPAPVDTATAVKTAPVKTKTEEVSYKDDTTTLKGIVAWDESTDKKRPGVLVVPEWWGVTDYTKSRASQLADLGYIAITVDMYGNGKIADNPKDAGNWAMPFYKNPQL
ncbi:MAG TPA: dienelactone hydrolase family protein, partial [Chitinophagaceae bacterium]|nr:dienelactone hydrolase family protein [Chitinophagaceae bacterium]